MHSAITGRIHGLVLGLTISIGAFAQTYFHSTVGMQSTYTGNCMVTTCSGTYYDNGGAAGNYGANVNNIFRTFCPNAAGMCVRATFTQFAMNDTYFLCFGPNSCCDYLSILNGPVQNSPALWSNCTASPGTITANNASGCLTFRFVSDGSVQLAGWTATLSCVPCGIGPSGTTNSDCAFATNVCSDVNLNDASTGPGITAEGCAGCVTSENYTNWYRIQIQTSGTLAFTINPNNNADDFDPVVFGPNVSCAAMGSPIRCSYAIGAGNGNTGLGNGAVDNSEDVYGDQWVAPINAIAGQIYYIMINGWSATSGSNGFLLDWTGTAGLNCTLPVEMLRVNAECADGRALVEWATASEWHNSHFTVERSPDGINWKEAGRVNGQGDTQEVTEYLFVDPEPASEGLMFYRVKQSDFSGEGSISRTVEVQGCQPHTGMTVAPNPTVDGVRVVLNSASAGAGNIEIRDIMGRLVAVAPLMDGRSADIGMGRLEAGTYNLSLRLPDGREVERAQIVKE
ncbi:MAG: hypothetical protein IPI81_15575 [Flavobacteriales bacterium]|nr:hypothetical protein [Flavobacteriales bacterium]